MEQVSDIRNVQTPLSLGNNGAHANRALWKQPRSHITSTPLQQSATGADPLLRRSTWQLDSSYLDASLAESPIFPARPKVNLVFGRKQSLESDRLSISTSVLTTLGKMELCDNNNDSAQENLQKRTADKLKKSDQGESSSTIDAQEKFKKQLNKNKKKKGISPKKKSPKVYKIGLKRIVPEVAAKKSSVAKKKSPKSKSPKTYKVCPTKKAVISSSAAAKQAKDPSKDEHATGTSDNYSTNKSSQHGTKHSELKMSRCAKSPKLRTAERALIKQHRDEIRKEKEKMLELYRQQELEERKHREEQEMMKMRQQTLFKANPIRKYAPLPNVKKRPLTDPISPNVCKRRRIETSSQSSSHQAGHNLQLERMKVSAKVKEKKKKKKKQQQQQQLVNA